MSRMMLHGLGDCTPAFNCGCMAKPPNVLRERIGQAIHDHLPGASCDAYKCRCGEKWTREHVADAVIAALGLDIKWGRAFARGDGSLFVDTEDDSYSSYSDAAERTTLYDEHSPYDFVVGQWVTPWERIEEDDT